MIPDRIWNRPTTYVTVWRYPKYMAPRGMAAPRSPRIVPSTTNGARIMKFVAPMSRMILFSFLRNSAATEIVLLIRNTNGEQHGDQDAEQESQDLIKAREAGCRTVGIVYLADSGKSFQISHHPVLIRDVV